MPKPQSEVEISSHIFSNAPNLVAVSLASVGLIKIYAALRRVTTLADNFLVVCLLAFLAATFLAYLSLRSTHQRRRMVLEKLADIVFLSGLTALTAVAAFMVFSLQG
jgi:hypothetical protein